MNATGTVLTAILFSVLAAFVTVKMTAPKGAAESKKSAYHHIIDSGVLRCGYGVSPPQLMKDPNTGKLSGIDYDVWQSIGRHLGLKIEWAEEAGWGNFIEGLRANRYDAFCSHMWADYSRMKFLALSLPINYSHLQAYARVGDKRFDGNLEAINNPAITVPAVDGDVSVMMAQTHFPKAKLLLLPQTATVSDLFLALTTKKADVFFFSPGMFAMFEKDNKGKLGMVKNVPSAFTMAGYYGFKPEETQLRDLINIALQDMINSGELEKIVHHYSKDYIVPKGAY